MLTSLTEEDKVILKQGLKEATSALLIVVMLIGLLLGIASLNSVSLWWKEAITVLCWCVAAFFFLSWIMLFKNYLHLKSDISGNVKKVIKGTIDHKKIGKRNTSYFFDDHYLEKIAAYQEDRKSGIKKDHGSFEARFSQDARLPFYIYLTNKEPYIIGVKDWLRVETGDNIIMEMAPRSQKVLRVTKA